MGNRQVSLHCLHMTANDFIALNSYEVRHLASTTQGSDSKRTRKCIHFSALPPPPCPYPHCEQSIVRLEEKVWVVDLGRGMSMIMWVDAPMMAATLRDGSNCPSCAVLYLHVCIRAQARTH
jgi:hypothetical protein